MKKPKANLLLIRDTFTDKSTIGKLYFNGEFYGHTLELPWKDNKKRVSCIPKGVYEVKKRHTEESKYKYEHLHILDVENRELILLHIGNYPKNSKGCILLGNTRAIIEYTKVVAVSSSIPSVSLRMVIKIAAMV